MSDLESRMGLRPLEDLQSDRTKLVKQAAPLRARYGRGGTAEKLEKIELARIAQAIRAKAVRDREKLTIPEVHDRTYSDERYIELVTTMTNDRSLLEELNDKITCLDEQIMWRHTEAKLIRDEMRL